MPNLKTTKEINLKLTDYLNKAFKVIPSNAFIHKGRTGIGGTHLELTTNRNSIIVVPTNSIITDKIDSKDKNGNPEYPGLFSVRAGVHPEDIKPYLLSNIPYKKIITTPDSLYKIIEAAKGNTDELYSGYFLLIDEAHAIITESYRESMIKAFEEQFNFQNRAVISATPYYFSDPRMENLDYYKIVFDKPLGTINIVNATSVKSCVNYFLTNANRVKGNLHIFYNSVTEIAEAIELAGLKDCNVHCADKEENKDKIGKFFSPQPIKGQYKKVNFYTTSHFEGWNLEDINPVIIFVTDVYKTHTKVGITNRGVQAIGRQRVKPNQPETIPTIYHITNHRNTETFKSMETFKSDYLFDAEWETDNYNRYIEDCKAQNHEPSKEKTDFVKKYANIDADTGKAGICHTKIDQFINESACNEEFNHINHIKEAWKQAGFKTEMLEYKECIVKQSKRKTTKTVKDIFSGFEALDPKKSFIFHSEETKKQLALLKSKYPVLYEAYQTLSKEEIESTNYNANEIEKLVIMKNNKDKEIRVMKLLPLSFSVGQRYTKEAIKSTLQSIYDEAEYIKKATAEQINIWYDTKLCKIKNKAGMYVNGYEFLRMTFTLKVSTK
ncbi:MAG: DEAD/DEAH box helicase family protein [Prevotellaceae bacterium]|jgi:hypothetical protein|nr:DEAD/DEAH box helicase family protein [Prevotellaceae bacterium]